MLLLNSCFEILCAVAVGFCFFIFCSYVFLTKYAIVGPHMDNSFSVLLAMELWGEDLKPSSLIYYRSGTGLPRLV